MSVFPTWPNFTLFHSHTHAHTWSHFPPWLAPWSHLASKATENERERWGKQHFFISASESGGKEKIIIAEWRQAWWNITTTPTTTTLYIEGKWLLYTFGKIRGGGRYKHTHTHTHYTNCFGSEDKRRLWWRQANFAIEMRPNVNEPLEGRITTVLLTAPLPLSKLPLVMAV